MKTLNFNNNGILLSLVIVLCLAGCQKEETLSLNSTQITLKRNQTFNLVVSPEATGCVFVSENDNIAEVSSLGIITAHIIGETNIVVTNVDKGLSAKCKVMVTNEYSMYREPYLVFGKPKSNIKSYETRQILSEVETSIMYTGENSFITAVLYLFENSTYDVSVCGIPSEYASLLGKFYAERYIYVGKIDDTTLGMKSLDSKIYVAIEVYSLSTIMVYYFPNDPTKSNSIFESDIELEKILSVNRDKAKAFFSKE